MKFEQLEALLEAVGKEEDGGAAVLASSSLNDNFALIAFLEEQKKADLLPPDRKDLPEQVKKLFAKRLLHDGGAFWTLFSGMTKCHQEIEGAGLIALDKEAAEYIAAEQTKAGYRPLLRAGNETETENILRGMLFNGFCRVRIYKSGCPYFEVSIPDVIELPQNPAEGADLRFHAIRFLQEIRRGVTPEILLEKERTMLRVAAGADLYLPGKHVENGNEKSLTHQCIRLHQGDKGQNLLPVYSAPQKLVQSPDFIKMQKEDAAWGVIRSNMAGLCRYCKASGGVIEGIVIDLHDFRLILPMPKMLQALSLNGQA